MEKNKKAHRLELRKDAVSGEWVIVAPERFHPETFFKTSKRRKIPPQAKDIFKDPLTTVSPDILWQYPPRGSWKLIVLENRYPMASRTAKKFSLGGMPYEVRPAQGKNELAITREYRKNFPHLSKKETVTLFASFQDRYRALAKEKGTAYVSIFHNWGRGAGASVFHPHYQILSVPIVPSEIKQSLSGSARYFRKNRQCVHCTGLAWEKKQKKRVIAESKHAIAFAPFVSKNFFEVRVFPKRHQAFFEETPKAELADCAALLAQALRKIEKNLKDPDYNFYIHTAPVSGKARNTHYHWHIEVVPRSHALGGFEVATGLYVNVADPDLVAKILRK